MPPKRMKAKAAPKRKHDEVKEEEKPKNETKEGEADTKDEAVEEPTQSADGTVKDESKPPKKMSKTTSPIDWLLSDEAFNLAHPEIPEGQGEIDWDRSKQPETPPREDAGKQSKGGEEILRYPQSYLTPFQNLVAASILSKPLSHKLGLRTIQTLLNPPFSLRSLKDVDEAGFEGRIKIMWEARTQHEKRTASLLGDLCEGIKELCGEVEEDLSQMTAIKDRIKECKSPSEAQRTVVDILTDIKGIGPGVAAIFLRRVQGDWEEVFPYIDERSLKAARAFRLVGEDEGAEELAEKVGKDRKTFVRLVDTLVGFELEKKLDEAFKQAGADE